MQRKNYKAYFTVEAAVLYPIVLGVIVLMSHALLSLKWRVYSINCSVFSI